MSTDLIMAIRKLEEIEIDNYTYSNVYLFATENISGFTKKLSFNDNNVLTVCSSGDQAFNLILNGANSVDLFDINIFTKYYFYFKKAAIEKLEYEEFINFFFPNFFNNKVFNFFTYLNIRDNIKQSNIKTFWDYLFCHYQGEKLYNSKLFHKLDNTKTNLINSNDYLLNKTNYNKLKELLTTKEFNFYSLNLFTDKIPNNNKYDFIYLSNIFDYLKINNKLEYTNKVKEIIFNLKSNLTDTGLVVVSYLYFYYDDYWYNQTNLKSSEFRNNYFQNDYEYIQFTGFSAPDDNQLRNKDALMLYRKKN